MRRPMTRLGFPAVTCLLACVLVTASMPAGAMERSARPSQCTGEDVGAGRQAARICRDAQYGVPSVYARQMQGVWFGTGWAQAEDRLFQIDLVRRNARGTLSQLFGGIDPSTIDQDKETLTLYYTDAELQAEFDALPSWVQDAVTNFVAGLNAYVDHAYATPESQAQLVPFQFWVVGQLLGIGLYRPPAFTALDVIANGNFLAREFGGGGGDELSNLSFLQFLQGKYGAQQGYAIFNDARWIDDPTAPVTVPDGRPVYGVGGQPGNPTPPAPPFLTPLASSSPRHDAPPAIVRAADRAWTRRHQLLESIGTRFHIPWKDGSNSWVVSPRKTANGHTFLWGGPQEGFGSPSIDWEVYQHGPGFDTGGMTIPLAPVVLIGRNADIAFTTTSEETVDQQVYQEQADFSHDPPTYRYNGADVPMQRVEHTITLPGQSPQTFVSYRTVHGPVIQTDPAHNIAYSMKFASFHLEWKSFLGFAMQSTAHNLWQYRDAMAQIATLHNFFYADREGNIAYFGVGLVPKLKPCPMLTSPQACDPRLPHAGDGSQEWLGTVPFDQMPHVVNPPQGFIANWNTKPSTAHYLQQNGGEEYWGTIYRSEPIARALEAKSRLSDQDLINIEANVGTIDDAGARAAAPYFLPKLFDAYDHDPALHTPQRDQAIAYLKAWNGTDTIGSVAMSIHTQWMMALLDQVFGANGTVPFTANGQDFTSKGSFHLLWHALSGTRGIVPCDNMCATFDYFGPHPDVLMMNALDEAMARLSGTGQLPAAYGAHGFGTTDMSKWGWVANANHDWADLDDVANTAADLGLLHKPDLGHSPTQNRSTWMQAIDLSPWSISGENVLPPGESGFISKDGVFSPHFADQVPLFNGFTYKPMPDPVDRPPPWAWHR